MSQIAAPILINEKNESFWEMTRLLWNSRMEKNIPKEQSNELNWIVLCTTQGGMLIFILD